MGFAGYTFFETAVIQPRRLRTARIDLTILVMFPLISALPPFVVRLLIAFGSGFLIAALL